MTRYFKYKESYVRYRETHKNELREWRAICRDRDRFGGMRNAILERDGFKCQKCGMTDKEHREKFMCSITVDHIDGNGRYSDTKNNDPKNLITLCLKCHGRKDRMAQLDVRDDGVVVGRKVEK